MANLHEWENKLEGGLQKLQQDRERVQQDLEKVQVSIQRQEGALMMVKELIKEQEKAANPEPQAAAIQ